ncbi:MAG TPA: chemotaxis protein CheB [Jatrophihabitantaceae bacterium]|jgi:two-component system chemotaxis response regulator CheB
MRRNVIVIGASAGGVEALRTVVAKLPADLPAVVLVVLHIPAYGGSVLPAILGRAGSLPARHPSIGEFLTPGTIFVAPPDHHLVVDGERAILTRGPHENGHRPAIDVLFRSAARACGARVVGVVLSGVLDDGTAGLTAVAARGGATVVQDPAEALYPGMPQSAIAHVDVDHIATADAMGGLLADLCMTEIGHIETPVSPLMEIEADLAMMDNEAMHQDERPGQPSGFSCPDCNGVLWEIRDGELVRYRCRVGHAWSAESLFGEQALQLDSALWMALRGLEEKAALARTMSERARERGNPLTAERFRDQEAEAARAAALIRTMLEAHVGTHDDESEAGA